MGQVKYVQRLYAKVVDVGESMERIGKRFRGKLEFATPHCEAVRRSIQRLLDELRPRVAREMPPPVISRGTGPRSKNILRVMRMFRERGRNGVSVRLVRSVLHTPSGAVAHNNIHSAMMWLRREGVSCERMGKGSDTHYRIQQEQEQEEVS